MPEKTPALRISISYTDGSESVFRRRHGSNDWSLAHTPPPGQGDMIRVSGYDPFNVTRVVVNSLDGTPEKEGQ